MVPQKERRWEERDRRISNSVPTATNERLRYSYREAV